MMCGDNVIFDKCRIRGCGGRFCRNACSSLRRFPILSFFRDAQGRRDSTREPESGQVCAIFTDFLASKAAAECDIPGLMETMYLLRLTVVASTVAEVKPGDIVSVGNRRMEIVRQLGEGSFRFELRELGEA